MFCRRTQPGCTGQGSNSRPSDPKSDALTTDLRLNFIRQEIKSWKTKSSIVILVGGTKCYLFVDAMCISYLIDGCSVAIDPAGGYVLQDQCR